MRQRALVPVLAVLGAVAVASGLAGIILGPGFIPGGAPVPASVDSEYRFANVFWLAAGVALWWSLFRLSERKSVTRVALMLAFVGGFARLISVAVEGWPHPVFIATLMLELVVVPLVIWWHARIVGLPRAESTTDSTAGQEAAQLLRRVASVRRRTGPTTLRWARTRSSPGARACARTCVEMRLHRMT